ncbi:unnamed protein product [Diamesa tonsa]
MRCLLQFLVLFLTQSVIFAASWSAEFNPEKVEVLTDLNLEVQLTLKGLTDNIIDAKNINDRNFLRLKSDHDDLATVRNQENIKFELKQDDGTWTSHFNVSGVFIGKAKIYVEIKTKANVSETSTESLDVIILRPKRFIDRLFIVSVIALVSLLYINFGAAIDLSKITEIMKKPVGPLICGCCQFIFMPLIAYGLGHLLFADKPELALGLFFTGVSPGGGASNMWALLLGANINLSIAMTTISTLLAFIMMPMWIFTLGKTIFDRADLKIPYKNIMYSAVGLVVPLMIGILIQKYMPRTAKMLVRIIKPCSIFLILFIVIFAIVTNLYLFSLFSLQIVIAGIGLPWLGYVFGWTSSKIFKQETSNALAIAIETGIQNTGISIFLLNALPQPAADLTTVIPVSVAIMTPFPLIALYLIFLYRRRSGPQAEPILSAENSPTAYS